MEVNGTDSSKIDDKVTIPGSGNSRFLIVNHEAGGILDLLRFVVSGNKQSGDKFLHYSDSGVVEELRRGDDSGGGGGDSGGGEDPDHRWVIFVSVIVRKLIAIFGKPMEWFGNLVEFILNLISLNGNFFGLLYNILHEAHLEHPVPKYFRVVYSNDLVPRLPYDNKIFLFKHFGICQYYNSLYIEQNVDEEPNRNYFGLRFLIPLYLNAWWELIRSFTMGHMYGSEYEECWESVLLRTLGLLLPGISAHSPVDYVNSVRLGRERSTQMSSF